MDDLNLGSPILGHHHHMLHNGFYGLILKGCPDAAGWTVA